MINDMFVFDCVLHVYDMSQENLRAERPDVASMMQGWHQALQPLRYPSEQERYPGPTGWDRAVSIEDVYEMEFVESPVDMALAHAVPVWDWFQNSLASVETQAAMAAKYPDRVLLCGAVDPLYHGVAGAKKEMKRQVQDLGARSFKFYNGHVDGSWSCDDRDLAYPLYRQALELGVNLLNFHKGLPFGEWDVEVLRPVDIQRPAREFRDINFVIHHLALPYFDEAVSVASRFPNVYLALSGILNFASVAPRLVQQWIGTLLQQVGPHKLLWGSEAAFTGAPRPFLEHFMSLEIPDDMRDGYGFPQLTDDDRRMILGSNLARLLDIDPGLKLRELAAAGVPGMD
jgi:predicted TIM-barrel fold metal-dependent hydrolase